MKKAYFFDMDGTLYNRKNHTVSLKTCLALQKLKDQGHFVGLCTSRCFQELQHLPSYIRNFSFDTMILDGGSFILDSNQNVLYKNPIDLKLMEKVNEYCLKHHILYRYSTSDQNYWGNIPNLQLHQVWMNLYLCTPVYKRYEKEEVLNLLIMTRELEHLNYFKDLFDHKGIVQYPDCIEIRSDGLDKAKAIQRIKEKENFDSVICFGDGENDIQMLKMAETGIAMGNALDIVKEQADLVIGSIEMDSIYQYVFKED